MLYSMTGFGTSLYKENSLSVAVELKTVNNRYFKLSLKGVDGYGAWEQRIESMVRSVIERGTINAHIRIIGGQEGAAYQINTAVLQSYVRQLSELASSLGQETNMPSWDRLLTLPGVITSDRENSEAENERVWTLLEKSIRTALDDLQTMRKTEGESMEKDLTANVEHIRRLLGKIIELAPRITPIYQQKLKERIEKTLADQGWTLGNTDTAQADFVRELAIYADRCDISEEVVRLQSHLEQFTAVIQSNERCGRKLDFLTQELFRETNTIGSKANDADITKLVVEIKTVIEKIREMVQNIE